MPTSPRRWIAVTAASAALATLPAVTPYPTSRDVRVVDHANVALTASWSPEQQAVIDDFARGGLAEVLRAQATSRLTHPDQVQIVNDFFEGGVIQTEGRRWIGLFADPQQQAFLTDLLTGGVVQIVRNRLLDSTSDPAARAAITAFFPDEVTDYRGGPITMLQRRLIAAAKGNQLVIAVVNAVFDNPITLTVRRLIGGGPIIGTPLPDLPPLEPTVTATRPAPAGEVATPTPAPVAGITAPEGDSRVIPPRPSPAVPERYDDATTAIAAPTEPEEPNVAAADPAGEPADIVKTGNKVAPTTLVPGAHRSSEPGGSGVFGLIGEALVAPIAGADAPTAAPAAPSAPSGANTGEPAGGDAGED